MSHCKVRVHYHNTQRSGSAVIVIPKTVEARTASDLDNYINQEVRKWNSENIVDYWEPIEIPGIPVGDNVFERAKPYTKQPTPTSNLKPCPACGSPNYVPGDGTYACANCGFSTSIDTDGDKFPDLVDCNPSDPTKQDFGGTRSTQERTYNGYRVSDYYYANGKWHLQPYAKPVK